MDSKNRMEMKQHIRQRVLETMDFTREVKDSEVIGALDEYIAEEARKTYIGVKDRQKLRKDVFNSLRRFDILQDLLEDESVTEIMVNGPDVIFIEKNGRLERFDGSFESVSRLEDVAQQMTALANRRINEASPIVDTRLPGGERVNIVLRPVSISGPTITIRKFSKDVLSMDHLLEIGSITKEAADFLQNLVAAGYNILVSGGTGSGKTTFLNILSGFVPPAERVITIEDSAELKLRNLPNLVSLESRNANVEGRNAVTIRDLIKTSLRMRPDRIIVGEVRGDEAIDMLQAMNTGHDGSLSTIHANSSKDVISRLETMILLSAEIPLPAVRGQIASAVDIIVQLGRMRDKSRKVLEICEVLNYEQGEVRISPLFSFVEEGEDENGRVLGALKASGQLRNIGKLRRAGICG